MPMLDELLGLTLHMEVTGHKLSYFKRYSFTNAGFFCENLQQRSMNAHLNLVLRRAWVFA